MADSKEGSGAAAPTPPIDFGICFSTGKSPFPRIKGVHRARTTGVMRCLPRLSEFPDPPLIVAPPSGGKEFLRGRLLYRPISDDRVYACVRFRRSMQIIIHQRQ